MAPLELSCEILTGALASATVRSSLTRGGEIMAGYVGSIEKQTIANNYFRQVLFTGKYAQLVVMCLQPSEEIGNEVHTKVDQFFRIEQGGATFVF